MERSDKRASARRAKHVKKAEGFHKKRKRSRYEKRRLTESPFVAGLIKKSNFLRDLRLLNELVKHLKL